jgi:hypothetical protein
VYCCLPAPLPPQIQGKENLPSSSTPAVYVANHQSFMVSQGARGGGGGGLAGGMVSRGWGGSGSGWQCR